MTIRFGYAVRVTRTGDTPARGAASDPAELLHQRLGYLLKHAQLRFAEVSTSTLDPLQLTGRELAALSILGSGPPMSQQDAAEHLGVDRTTMVSLVDGLEDKRLVHRRADPSDRRRNIVQLTVAGEHALDAGLAASARAEQEFLAPLTAAEASVFTRALRRLLAASPPPGP